MRVYVTGGQGFIGGHLLLQLGRRGHELFQADIRSPLRVDLLEDGRLAGQLETLHPDVVVHLAAQVGRVFGERDVRHTIAANGLLTTLVAQECGSRGIPVLYASSSEVYGDQGAAVCDEDGPLVLPHNLYGLTKRWGEEALRLYAPDGLRIARLTMPYGPGAPPGVGRRAMDTLLWQAHHRMPMTVHHGAIRSWCHVTDTVRALEMLLTAEPGIYNVGRDDRPVSMLKLAQMCCALTGAGYSLIDEVDPPAAQTVVKRLSTGKIRALGWEPRVELEQGLRELLEWVKRFDSDGEMLREAA